MLVIDNLAVQYENHLRPSVEKFNLKVKPGEICSIVGESGSGKTTILRAISGCLAGGGKIVSGEIYFEGESLTRCGKQRWRKLLGSEISIIFQDAGAMLNPVRRIGSQYVEYIRAHRDVSKKEAWDMGVEMLEKMRLPKGSNIMKSYTFQLSGGMRQRVGIAMAMTFGPKLLLADEPTSALDVTTQAQIVQQMMELRDIFGTSILLVTHNIGVAVYMGDNIVVMKNGTIMDEGDKDQILHHAQSEYTRYLLEAVPTMKGKRYV